MGGTGKTPMVEWIARWFRGHDVRVTIISRGYGAEAGAKNDEALELEQRLPDVPHLHNPDRVAAAEYARRPIARYYHSAGTREKPFRNTARAVAKLLTKHGVEHVQTERPDGHDFDFWNTELIEAIRWSFPDRRRNWRRRVMAFFSQRAEKH